MSVSILTPKAGSHGTGFVPWALGVYKIVRVAHSPPAHHEAGGADFRFLKL